MLQLMNEYGKHNIPFLFVLDFDLQRPVIIPLSEVAQHNIYFNVKGFKNYTYLDTFPHKVVFDKTPVSLERYRLAFDLVQQHLQLGDSFLANLTFPSQIQTNLQLHHIFEHTTAPYRLLFQDEFVTFSPESFVTIENGKIASFPMKGTIDATLPNAKAKILADYKERAEHNTIVDLIRNDLSRVAKQVKVERFRYIDRVETSDKALLQVSSEIAGQLPIDYASHLGDIFENLLPAGSISGAPKPKTLSIIKNAEGYNRNYYTGIFGYYIDGKVESGVMIRFIEKTGSGLYYKSGGGITIYSEVEKEYQELIDKIYVPIHRKYSNFQRSNRKLGIPQ